MPALTDLPNLRHLKGFLAVVELGKLSLAAQSIGLSQPALTQGIAKIERWLGIPLFRRAAAGMTPTEPARIFAIRVRRALDLLSRGAAAAAGGRTHVHRHFTAGQLRALIAAVECGGFAAAARALGREASNVNRACRDLERLAGAPLFETTSSGIRPTRQAEALSRMGKLALGEIRQGVDDVNAWRGEHTGRLAIGCLPLAQADILPRALCLFADEYPGMDVAVVDGVYASLARGVLRGDLDLLIGALRSDDLPEELVQSEMFSAPLAVVARAGHPLGAVPAVTPDMLAAYPWVAPRSGAPARAYFEKLRAGLTVPAHVPRPIETGAHPVMRGVLLASDRITLASMGQVQSDVERGVLIRLAADLPDSARPIGATWREGWVPGLPHARFLDILRRTAVEGR